MMSLKPTSTASEPGISSKTKTKKKHFIGQKVKLFVAGEPVLNVLMWGINHTVNDLSHLPVPVMLLPDDFKAHSKIKVDNHLFSREHLPGHFKFKEYCPLVFRNVRERFGVDDQDYLGSLTKGVPLKIDSQGRFGHRIFYSCDRRLVVKTVSGEDVAEIHNILKRYHQFVVECHGATLLPQFLAMYKLTVDGVDTFAVVTRNVFSHRLAVHRKYDLKGSTVAREASHKEKTKELPTLKDNDFLSQGHRLQTGSDSKQHVLEKLKRDVEFLATLKMMDYSLLLGIHDVEKAEQEETGAEAAGGDQEECESRTSGVILSPGEFDPSVDVYAIKSHSQAAKREVYFMAIIGILTHYDAKKKAAHAAKTVKHGAGADISTVNPEQYSKRFLEFISGILI